MARALRHHLLLAAGLILAACSAPQAPAPADQPAPAHAGAAAPSPGLVDASPLSSPHAADGSPGAILPPRPPARTAEPVIPERAVDLIIAFEVGSPDVYTAKYTRPIWPGAASGVTIGIGYDLGHRAPGIIALDWEAHPHHVRLATASGVTGPVARDFARRLADVSVEYGLAREVFDQTMLVEHYRIARRVFGAEQFDALPPNAQGALVSLVFNRGGAMAGERRTEMRHIRDVCVPRGDAPCIAAQLRAMVRLWAGTDIEAGMRRRRYAEADLAVAA